MNLPGEIYISEYNYHLPENRIAKFPLKERDNSRLLLYNGKIDKIKDDDFYNLANYIPSESLMVFNNTRVIYARLKFRKPSGAEIEIFCLQPLKPADYNLIFGERNKCSWLCLVGNLKRWKSRELIKTININAKTIELCATRIQSVGSSWEIEFSWNNTEITFSEILNEAGDIPIPPYLKRDSLPSDKTDYQTIYSRNDGSVAAPTAGLHFTEKVFEELEKKSVQKLEITLHVGAGTFQPVKSDTVNQHEMHFEKFFVTKKGIEKLLQHPEDTFAVGTTSVRTLESIYWLGVKLLSDEYCDLRLEQWDCYNLPQNIPVKISLDALLEKMKKSKLDFIEAATQIIIVPGYKFRMIKGMVTNFHQPKSTLLLLIAAFIGEAWKDVYKYALDNNFRFLSYGDSSLLLPQDV